MPRGTNIHYFLLPLIACCFILLFLQPAEAEKITPHLNIDKTQTALKGYDPVSYFSSSPVPGRKDITFAHQGIRFHFASRKNLLIFQGNPTKHMPAFGGWCAWAMLEGEKVDINPQRYKIIASKVYLFYDGFWGNTLKKWNSLADKDSEQNLVEKARKHWRKIVVPYPDQQER